MKRAASLLLLVAVAATCKRQQESGPPRPQAAIAASKAFPENYVTIIDEAWAGDSLALVALFGFEDQGAFAGRARTEHRQVLWSVLQHIGDGSFATIARPELPRVRAVVLQALEEASNGKVDTLFPLTHAALATP